MSRFFSEHQSWLHFTPLSRDVDHKWTLLHDSCACVSDQASVDPEAVQTIALLSRCVASKIHCISQTSLLVQKSWTEQSDREANECWLNRWVVTLPHWRGFTGDMLHCFTKLVGWQWVHSVGCLCMECQSVTHKQSMGCSWYVFTTALQLMFI